MRPEGGSSAGRGSPRPLGALVDPHVKLSDCQPGDIELVDSQPLDPGPPHGESPDGQRAECRWSQRESSGRHRSARKRAVGERADRHRSLTGRTPLRRLGPQSDTTTSTHGSAPSFRGDIAFASLRDCGYRGECFLSAITETAFLPATKIPVALSPTAKTPVA